MEDTTQTIVTHNPLSLKEYCCKGFFKQEASQAGTQLNDAITTKKIPDVLIETLLINAAKTKPADYFALLVEQTPSIASFYPLMGLSIISQPDPENKNKGEKQQKIAALLAQCTHKNDRNILKVFTCCLNNTTGKPIKNKKLYKTALDHRKKKH